MGYESRMKNSALTKEIYFGLEEVVAIRPNVLFFERQFGKEKIGNVF